MKIRKFLFTGLYKLLCCDEDCVGLLMTWRMDVGTVAVAADDEPDDDAALSICCGTCTDDGTLCVSTITFCDIGGNGLLGGDGGN